jgi:hypothetical protein
MSLKHLKDFVTTIYKTSGYIPTVPTGDQVNFGDLLLISRKVGKPVDFIGNISDPLIGIETETEEDPTPSDEKLANSSGMDFSLKLEGQSLEGSSIPLKKAGVIVEFSKQGGFLFEPTGVRYNRIKNLISIRQEILRKVPKELLGISEVFFVKQIAHVETYALVVSAESKGRLEVSADAEIGIGDLAKTDAKLGLKIARAKSLAHQLIGKKGGSIFYKAEKIKLRDTIPNKTRTEILSKREIEFTEKMDEYFEFTDLNIEDVYNMFNIEL